MGWSSLDSLLSFVRDPTEYVPYTLALLQRCIAAPCGLGQRPVSVSGLQYLGRSIPSLTWTPNVIGPGNSSYYFFFLSSVHLSKAHRTEPELLSVRLLSSYVSGMSTFDVLCQVLLILFCLLLITPSTHTHFIRQLDSSLASKIKTIKRVFNYDRLSAEVQASATLPLNWQTPLVLHESPINKKLVLSSFPSSFTSA